MELLSVKCLKHSLLYIFYLLDLCSHGPTGTIANFSCQPAYMLAVIGIWIGLEVGEICLIFVPISKMNMVTPLFFCGVLLSALSETHFWWLEGYITVSTLG